MSSSSVDVMWAIVLPRKACLRGDEGRSREPGELEGLFFCAASTVRERRPFEVAGLRGAGRIVHVREERGARELRRRDAVTRELHREDGNRIPIATSLSPMRNAPSAPTR